MKTNTEAKIRKMLHSDLENILDIEKRCYSDPWDLAEFKHCLGRDATTCGRLVAVVDKQVVGYIIYEVCKSHYGLVNVTVHPEWQGVGIGRQMVEVVIKKLGPRRSSIKMAVSERCEQSHYFLSSLAFRAVKVERAYFIVGDSYEDAYHFRYDAGKPCSHELVRDDPSSVAG